MSLMKFVSNSKTAVEDFLLSLKSNPAVSVDTKRRIIINNDISTNQVCLLSGGGSGHEPFSAGYVGTNMLSGAVAGLIFASPPIGTIYDSICTLATENDNSGVLIVVLNYTGDILNFGVATEKAKTHNIVVETVVVAEDCSRTGNEVLGAGKRGMCGACFVFKIGGSMATKDIPLSEIAEQCRSVNENMATIGCAVSSCTVPGRGILLKINSDEVDIGLGVHGEAGVRRTKMTTIDDLIEDMLSKLVQTLNLSPTSRVCVIVNNLGSVSQLEIGIISGKVQTSLTNKNMEVIRLYTGSFMTSLDMAGFQISILNITNHAHWLHHLDCYTDASAWHGTDQNIPSGKAPIEIKDYSGEVISEVGPKFTPEETIIFEKCLKAIANDLIQAESYLNELDSAAGDGDAGSTLRRFADGVNSASNIQYEYPAVAFSQLAKISEDVMGGTSGALYSFLLTGAAQFLLSACDIDWVLLGQSAIDTMMKYTTARLGDRTMVDALLPAFEEFSNQKTNNVGARQACVSAAVVARTKCRETQNMKSKLGRASYVPHEYIKDVDPGSYGVTVWIRAICNVLDVSFT